MSAWRMSKGDRRHRHHAAHETVHGEKLGGEGAFERAQSKYNLLDERQANAVSFLNIRLGLQTRLLNTLAPSSQRLADALDLSIREKERQVEQLIREVEEAENRTKLLEQWMEALGCSSP